MVDKKEDFIEYLLRMYDEYTVQQIELDSSLNECASAKIPIFKKEHPEWTHEHVVGAAMGYCRQKLSDVYKLNTKLNVPRVRGGKIVKTLRSKAGLKVGHMGLDPLKAELPMVVTLSGIVTLVSALL